MAATKYPTLDPTFWYTSDAQELDVLGAKQTRNRWRHEGKGPRYVKYCGRILYRGKDVIDFLEANLVEV